MLLTLVVIGVSKAQTNELVVMDSQYAQKQDVLNRLPSNSHFLEINGEDNPWKTIREYVQQNSSIQTIHLFVNASYNAFELGGITYGTQQVAQEFELSMLEGLYQVNKDSLSTGSLIYKRWNRPIKVPLEVYL